MSKRDSTLTQERLKQLLHYDPETGIFTRIFKPCNSVKIGEIAGTLHIKGYINIKLLGKGHRAHRLAWLYMTGEWPIYEIDHINGGKANNKWNNLRDVPHQINCQNQRKAQKPNKCGFMGVCLDKAKKKWVAQINSANGHIHIGTFATPEEAHEAYITAKRRLHEGCTI